VSLEVLKRAEDGDGLVLRGYETTGRPETVEASLLGEPLGRLAFGPHEIKSWRLRRRGSGWTVSECDLLEREAQGSAL
jgi:hypothetical protein